MPAEGIDLKLLRLLRGVRTWFAMRREPLVFTGDPDDALRQLGRSIRILAETTPQVGAQPGANRSATLASSLQIVTRRQIDDDWRTGPIMAVGDRVPQAVNAPVVDAATRDELAALASATPQALLTRPVPSSVLGRMARYATLLEWSRLARAAVEASVDIASRRDLQAKAVTSGSDLYINVMFRAFFPLPSPPVPPILSPGGVLSAGRDRDPLGPVRIPDPLQPARPIDPDGPIDPFPEPNPDDPRPRPRPIPTGDPA